MSSYQLYRNTTLGHTLQESLDELIQVIFALKYFHTNKLCFVLKYIRLLFIIL